VNFVLSCLYIAGLLVSLFKAGVECFVGHNFVGAFAYADNIGTYRMPASALRIMLSIVEKANDYEY
jgi:hypothetical protein